MAELTETQQAIGQILPASSERDAIHIAVAPVVAGQVLYPGQHIGLDAEGRATTGTPPSDPCTLIGIVDPFLPGRVDPEQRCWMFLYPNTITSLRHQWTHPAFAESPTLARNFKTIPGTMVASVNWLADFAKDLGLSYNNLLEVLDEYQRTGTMYGFGQDLPERVYDDRALMWKHYATVRNLVTPRDSDIPFSCAC